MPVADELIDRFLDGDVAEDEAADVMQWLEVPANLERFARRAELHADLRNSLRRRSIQARALDACNENEIDRVPAMSAQPISAGSNRLRMTVGFGVAALVTAACLLIAFMIDRFIRNFDEPKRKYARLVKRLSPLAYYRMPIRDRGLISEPPQHSGVVLTGDGIRPPHARGVFTGGSLRVSADSTGRGGRVDSPPPLGRGQFTLAVFVYLQTQTHGGTVATNIQGDEGSFALSLDENGLLRAMIRNSDGELQSVASDALLPPRTWLHVVMTANGDQLRLFEDGQLVANTQCEMMTTSDSATVWFGTDANGLGMWNGRIDELALFDKALSDTDIADLYQAALEEMARSE